MSLNPDIKRALRAAYVHKMLMMEQAAADAKVSLGTAIRWKREAKQQGDDWDRARAAAMLSSEGAEEVSRAVLEQFVLLFQSTLEALKNDKESSPLSKAEAISRLSDAYNKTMSAVAKSNPKINRLALAMDVIKLLTDFILANYPNHAPAFSEILSPFGHHLTKEFA